MAKPKVIRFRAETVEASAFEEAARLSGLTLSRWVVLILRKAAEERLASVDKRPGWA